MTSNGKKKYFLDPIIDSDDSDYECLHGKMIEDLKYEIDVARFYRTLLNKNSTDRNSNKTSGKHKKISKAVQTDPDTSGIPESWINFSEELVSQLYTGLANMINTLYHTPHGYCKGDADKGMLHPPDMKFFNYDNGYWQSKLLPQVKIPATVGISRQIHSENFKSELNSLLEKATKLRNIFPNIMEEGADRTIVEDEINAGANESSPKKQGEVLGKITLGEAACSSEIDVGSRTDSSEKYDTDSVVSEPTTRSRANASKPLFKGNTQKPSNGAVSNRTNAQSHDTKSIPGVSVAKFNPPRQASKCVQISVPKQHDSRQLVGRTTEGNSSNRNRLIIVEGMPKTSTPIGKATAFHGLDRCAANASVVKGMQGKLENAGNLNREKRNAERNPNAAGNAAGSSKGGKNFIKKNILASKSTAHRGGATTSKSTRDVQFSRNGAAHR